jgi:hypothetical protein
MDLVVDNPLGASSTGSSVPEEEGEELVTSFLDAKDWTPAQVKQLQALMEARDERQRVRHENTMARAIKDVAGWLTEAAPNWHQATVFFATSDAPADAVATKRAPLFMLISWLIVAAQCFVAVGVQAAVKAPSCVSNDQCNQLGQFCMAGMVDGPGDTQQDADAIKEGDVGSCGYCGGPLTPVLMELAPGAAPGCSLGVASTPECPIINNADEVHFGGFNLTAVQLLCANPINRGPQRFGMSRTGGIPGTDAGDKGVLYFWNDHFVRQWCDACVHAATGDVSTLEEKALMRMNVASMKAVDWCALVLASGLVGLTVIGERKDIELCTLAMRHAPDSGRYWRWSLVLLNGVRQWVFLPGLTGAISSLVMWRGSDSLSICLNTVAILFLAEVIHLLF